MQPKCILESITSTISRGSLVHEVIFPWTRDEREKKKKNTVESKPYPLSSTTLGPFHLFI